ncbi:MAG: hypothetical protein C0505_03285 [Leptothrix sp. (in: Bacteria)]|nr:hypothetical protein [Leptothrix sp. (in: b-proteobacteria)]
MQVARARFVGHGQQLRQGLGRCACQRLFGLHDQAQFGPAVARRQRLGLGQQRSRILAQPALQSGSSTSQRTAWRAGMRRAAASASPPSTWPARACWPRSSQTCARIRRATGTREGLRSARMLSARRHPSSAAP